MATRGQEVKTKLRERLINGHYEPGSRLNEVDLAAELGTSRTPVRAALNHLASDGLVVYRPNAGFVVRAFNADYIAGVYDVRSSLEGLAARLAAEAGVSDEARGTLHRLVAETDEVIARGPDGPDAIRKLSDLNNAFHQAIICAARNEHLAEMLDRTRNLPRIETINRDVFDFAFIARAHEDHEYILKAILQGQGARAEALSQEHVRRGSQRMLEYFREQEMSEAERRRPRSKGRMVAV